MQGGSAPQTPSLGAQFGSTLGSLGGLYLAKGLYGGGGGGQGELVGDQMWKLR